jgi:hypothetical protein
MENEQYYQQSNQTHINQQQYNSSLNNQYSQANPSSSYIPAPHEQFNMKQHEQYQQQSNMKQYEMQPSSLNTNSSLPEPLHSELVQLLSKIV